MPKTLHVDIDDPVSILGAAQTMGFAASVRGGIITKEQADQVLDKCQEALNVLFDNIDAMGDESNVQALYSIADGNFTQKEMTDAPETQEQAPNASPLALARGETKADGTGV